MEKWPGKIQFTDGQGTAEKTATEETLGVSGVTAPYEAPRTRVLGTLSCRPRWGERGRPRPSTTSWLRSAGQGGKITWFCSITSSNHKEIGSRKKTKNELKNSHKI